MESVADLTGANLFKSASEAVSKDDFKKLTYTTCSGQRFFPKRIAIKDPVLDDLYDVGLRRKRYNPKVAPTYDRGFQMYTYNYADRGNFDYVENKALAECNRPGGTASLPVLGDAKDMKTEYSGVLVRYPVDKMRSAKQKKPAFDKTIECTRRVCASAGDVVLERKPISQDHFAVRQDVKMCEPVLPIEAIHTRPPDHYDDLGAKTASHLAYGPQQKRTPPKAQPRKLHRGASVGQPGGPSYRMKHFSDRQADYLVATGSFTRGFPGLPPKSR